MAIDFPSSPTVGQKYTFAGVTYTYTAGGVWAGGTVGTTTYIASATAPVLPNPGNFWYDLTTGILSIYVDDGNSQQWVQVSPVPAQPPTTVITTDALANNGLQVNGAMEISQELGTATRVTSGYVVDGWQVAGAGTMAITAGQVADAPPGYTNSLKITVTTAEVSMVGSDYLFVKQAIEGFRTSRLQWGKASAQPVSIGFWTKIHRPGAYSGSIRNPGFTRSYPFSFTQNVADTWEYKTVTVPGDVTGTWIGNTNGIALELDFTMAAGPGLQGPVNVWSPAGYIGVTGTINGVAATTDTFQITGVVVLPGVELPSALKAPFIMRQYDQERMLCRRYYVNETYGAGGLWVLAIDGTAQYRRFHYRFNPEMRAVPVVTVTGGVAGTFLAGMPKAASITTYSCELQGDLTTAAGYSYILTLIADARL